MGQGGPNVPSYDSTTGRSKGLRMRNVLTASILTAFLAGCGTQSTLRMEGYYSSAHGKTGRELKSALHAIIDGHGPISYGEVRQAFALTDAACPPDVPRCGLVQLLYWDDTRALELDRGYRGSCSAP